ncbi:hypothetical protein ACG94M_12195 [Acinetobacter guillouiae]|uniref:hypothetical protein n=1 Tax=Acinetobacter guillouiae TaxID=106649 RepID=UPI003AF5E43B
MIKHKGLEASILPQYSNSPAFYERFLISAHEEKGEINRSLNIRGEKKFIDEKELDLDYLNYFTEEKEKFRLEFIRELRQRNVHEEEIKIFCEVIAQEWFDGKRLRNEGKVLCLKRSIYDYLSKIVNSSIDPINFVQSQKSLIDIKPLISVQAIASILTVNDQMLYRYIEEWKNIHPNRDRISSDDIFLRRGLVLDNKFISDTTYKEWDFLNSYSIAFSAPEKFSQMENGKIPTIVNGDLSLFENRVLFFSPFIPEMDVGQLEFGIIPSEHKQTITCQGIYSDIYEYIINQ